MQLKSSSKQLDSLLRRSFYCPSCSTLRLIAPSEAPRKRPRLERFSSTSSTTAINGTRPIPPSNRALYDALSEVKSKASSHVNISRLQLALQSLESEEPVTRVAILGLNVQDTARRIARLLLIDPLEDEHGWEKQIINHQGTDGILLRFGQPQNTNIPQRSTIPILQIPSPTLEKLNLEILISCVNSERSNGTSVPVEAFLAPAVGVPTAFDGRQVTVNQPVHRTLIVAYGFKELVAAVELLAATRFVSVEDRRAVALAANLPNSNAQSDTSVLVSDVARAEQGLKAIRSSTSQATVYEHNWLASGMPQINSWLSEEVQTSSGTASPPLVVQELVSSLLASASASINQSASEALQKIQSQSIDPIVKIRIEDAVESFSRAAHQELQSGLASAWSSRNWRKLSWYKLFWRVDDVGLIMSDLVTNTWLPRTERATYEFSGRLAQLGINPVMAELASPAAQHRTAFDPEPETARATILDPAPPLLATATSGPANELITPQVQPVLQTSPRTNQAEVELRAPPAPVPITTAISSARTTYLSNQITLLTTTAQQLVFRTLSISGLSAGLSALVYVSSLAPTLYEAGSIFAVGTVFALYRMQTSWQIATKALERGLFEEGRDVVRRVVERLRELVNRKVQEVSRGDPVEEKMLRDAKGAVERAESALRELRERKS